MDQKGELSQSVDVLISREWMVANGIGGYAASTALGCNTRKYHGLLVAAMTPPVRRMVILSRVEESIIDRGWPHPLACAEYPGTLHPEGHQFLRAFNNEAYPRWGYQGDGWTLVKQVRLLKGRNAVCLRYILLGQAREVELEIRPLFALRGIHELMYQWDGGPPVQQVDAYQYRIQPTRRTPEAFFAHDGAFIPEPFWYFNNLYRHEPQRGYNGVEDLWMPGAIRWKLHPGQHVNLIVSTEPIDLPATLAEVDLEDAPPVPMHGLAIDQTPALDTLIHAAGVFTLELPDEYAATPPIITDYPWSAPLMRDAMIGFTGLFLATGRFEQARKMLLALAGHEQNGLLPSEFPEDGAPPLYDAPDVSLWFVQAVFDYLRYTRDEKTVIDRLLPVIARIVNPILNSSTPDGAQTPDGLVCTGPGQTWMNAAVGKQIITPRQGCAVEVNALAYNALRIAADLAQQAGQSSRALAWNARAQTLKAAFNRHFWNESAGCCFDVLDGDHADAAIRPNQLLAIALPHPVLDATRHPAVLNVIDQKLLTPLGLRTLAADDPHFAPHKQGTPLARARARHQGTVYPWLLGPLANAIARIDGRGDATRRRLEAMLQPCIDYMQGDGLGQLCELFEGAPPHHPGGAMASAASVGQVLAAYVEHVLDSGTAVSPGIQPPALDPKTFPVSPKIV